MRLEWWRDFRQRGAEDVRRQVYRSTFENDKHRAAERWLWWHDHGLKVIGITAAMVTAAAAVAQLFKAP
jgi:phosphoserine phosphatase